MVRLGDLAHARSGDKGNSANIGVVANDDASFQWLRTHLTEAAVAAYLDPLEIGRVRHYELPHLRAFNFVIEKAWPAAPAGRCGWIPRAKHSEWRSWNCVCRPLKAWHPAILRRQRNPDLFAPASLSSSWKTRVEPTDHWLLATTVS